MKIAKSAEADHSEEDEDAAGPVHDHVGARDDEDDRAGRAEQDAAASVGERHVGEAVLAVDEVAGRGDRDHEGDA